MDDDSHKDSNCFSLTIICHGNDKGHLLDRDRRKAWDTELFVGELSDVETLVGKPKIMVIQSCRGCECLIPEVLVGKPKVMIIQSYRGCECLILEVLMGKPKIMVIQSCRGCKCLILGVLVRKPKIMVIQSCRGCKCLILRYWWGNPRS